MGNLTREEKLRRKEQARKREQRQLMLTIGGIAAVILLIVIVAVAVNAAGSAHKNMTATLSEDGSLHVARADLGTYFNYVDWGGPEELILYPTGDGSVVAAFDTCETCYLEGDVHFKRSRDNTVCSVCGTVASVEEMAHQEWGGCRPIAIPASARLDTADEIVISSEAISYALDMFHHWDEGDMTVTFADFDS